MAENSETATGAGTATLVWDGSVEEEIQLLNQIVLDGYDQGCFLRPSPETLIDGSTQNEILGLLGSKATQDYTEENPFESSSIPTSQIDGLETGFVIVNQRCDLVRSLRDEPFVELAQADHIEDKEVISKARKNSPRLIYLAETDTGAWVIDLRKRAVMPKQFLADHDATLPIPEGRARRDFAYRIGRRYSRNAVPNDIVLGFQRQLADMVKKPKFTKQSHLFSELLVYRHEDDPEHTLVFIGLIDDAADRAVAQTYFEGWIQELEREKDPKKKITFKIAPESAAVTADDIPLGLWKDSYRLDLDENSRGPKATEDTATPVVP